MLAVTCGKGNLLLVQNPGDALGNCPQNVSLLLLYIIYIILVVTCQKAVLVLVHIFGYHTLVYRPETLLTLALNQTE